MQDFDVKNLLDYEEGNTRRTHESQSVFYMTEPDDYQNVDVFLTSSNSTRLSSYTQASSSSEDDAYDETVIPQRSSDTIPPVPVPKVAAGPKPQVKAKPPGRRTSAKVHVDPWHMTGSEYAPAEGATPSAVTARKKSEPEHISMRSQQPNAGSGSKMKATPERKSVKPQPNESVSFLQYRLPIPPVPAHRVATGPKPQVKFKLPARRTKLSAKVHVDAWHTGESEYTPAKAAAPSAVTTRKESEFEYTYMQPTQTNTNVKTRKPVKPQPTERDLEDRLQALESRLSKQEEAHKELTFEVEQLRALTRLPDIPLKGSRSSDDNKLSSSLALPSHAQSMKEKNQSIVSSLTVTQVSCVPIPLVSGTCFVSQCGLRAQTSTN